MQFGFDELKNVFLKKKSLCIYFSVHRKRKKERKKERNIKGSEQEKKR